MGGSLTPFALAADAETRGWGKKPPGTAGSSTGSTPSSPWPMLADPQ